MMNNDNKKTKSIMYLILHLVNKFIGKLIITYLKLKIHCILFLKHPNDL